MIELSCTDCQAALRVDDAFAGGVCRCRACGAIQTVPRRAKPGATSPAPRPRAGRVLHRRSAGPTASGTGLEELGEMVSSSGLHARRLRQPPAGAEVVQVGGDGRRTVGRAAVALGAALAAVIVLLVGLLLLRSPGRAAPAEATAAPTFLATPLPGDGPVVYVVDLGRQTAPFLADVGRAVAASAASLGPRREVQAVVAGAAGPKFAFPAGPAPATAGAVRRLAEALDRPPAGGTDFLRAAVAAAGEADGGVLVLLSGKAWQLDAAFADAVAEAAAGHDARVLAVALGGDSYDGAFEALAARTGGRFATYTEPELAAAAAR